MIELRQAVLIVQHPISNSHLFYRFSEALYSASLRSLRSVKSSDDLVFASFSSERTEVSSPRQSVL